jgi:hypothetical protein
VALAAAVQRLVADPALAARLASNGAYDVLRRFSPANYRREITTIVREVAER